ncbi:hypothetical protein CC80DRAFT_254231 [Byssothecium circinans]|uniref:F-box domain-containing protein n=1 Tax=Byssothecium circinans TaxID=147558 RepID=A0A6A5T9S4_9PLEO|nr:hypothetical protein CC80DRAFT_254231 [Byssothecium circinans]
MEPKDHLYKSSLTTTKDYLYHCHLLSQCKERRPPSNVERPLHIVNYTDFFPSRINQPSDLENANKATDENSQQRMVKLLPELLLCIADLLPQPDRAILRSVCQHFRTVLMNNSGGLMSTPLTGVERADVMTRYQFDRFKTTTDLPQMLLCSFCLDFHGPSFFTDSEKAKHPHERVCKGSSATFYICPHRRYSFQQLFEITHQRSMNPHLGFWSSELLRGSCGCYLNRQRLISDKHVNCSSLLMTGLGRFSWARQSLLIPARARARLDSSITDGQMQNALVELGEFVCPHSRTSDTEIFDMFRAAKDIWWWRRHGRFNGGWPKKGVSACCHDCRAIMRLRRLRNTGPYMLYMFRSVRVTTVVDRHWLANVC